MSHNKDISQKKVHYRRDVQCLHETFMVFWFSLNKHSLYLMLRVLNMLEVSFSSIEAVSLSSEIECSELMRAVHSSFIYKRSRTKKLTCFIPLAQFQQML